MLVVIPIYFSINRPTKNYGYICVITTKIKIERWKFKLKDPPSSLVFEDYYENEVNNGSQLDYSRFFKKIIDNNPEIQDIDKDD